MLGRLFHTNYINRCEAGRLKKLKAHFDFKQEINQADQIGRTPLMLACADLKDVETKQLLAAGANPNLQDRSGRTALFYAEGPAKIRLLLDAGADWKMKTKDGITPLVYHIVRGNTQNVETLLRAGIDIDQSCISGNTPLMFAASYSNDQFISLLLEFNANPEFQNKEGNTALMLAIRYRKPNAAKILLMNGANATTIQNHRGKTAKDLAKINGLVEIVKLIEDSY